MILRLERPVLLLKLLPVVFILDVHLFELTLIFLTHLELLALSVPDKHFLDA